MSKMTLSQARLTRIPDVLKLCPSDSRLASYLNEAVSRLLPLGKWRGTMARYRICASSNCLTWPRQIETIEAFAICDQPISIRSHWYEYLDYGPGLSAGCGCWCSGAALLDRGLAVSFDDIQGLDKKIRIYVDLPVDAGKKILLQGYDENKNWVLSSSGDINGEEVTLVHPYADTTKKFSALTGVQKALTKGFVRLYELNTVNGAQKPLAFYEPDELLPEYRRSFVPGLEDSWSCCPSSDCADPSCAQTRVTVMAKLKFIPVAAETDWLLIGNEAALKDMCQAVVKREQNLIGEALAYEASALSILNAELSNFHGDATVDPVRTINGHVTGGGVTSLI